MRSLKSLLSTAPAGILPYVLQPSTLIRNVQWRVRACISESRHIFIVGAPRSGTTLVENILNSHPAICSSLHETALFGPQNIFDPERQHFGLPNDVLSHLLGESTDVVAFFDSASALLMEDAVEAERFLEKTPAHVLRLRFILFHFPRAQVVHVVRDGRDAYCSARSGGIPHSSSLDDFASYWVRCIEGRVSCEGSEHVIDLRYEDLCLRPDEEMNRVLDFLQLDSQGIELSASSRLSDPRASRPLHLRLAEQVNAARVGRYSSELDAGEISRFNELAFSQLRRFGYSTD